MSMKHGGLASRPSSAQAGQQGRKQAAATLEGSASHLPGTRNEAVVMLEDAEVDWDVADIQKVQQRARNMTGRALLHCLLWEALILPSLCNIR